MYPTILVRNGMPSSANSGSNSGVGMIIFNDRLVASLARDSMVSNFSSSISLLPIRVFIGPKGFVS